MKVDYRAELVITLWLIFPAYVANALPVIFGGGKPLDFNRKFLDGKPLLGKGKTIRGAIAGILGGWITAFVQNRVSLQLGLEFYSTTEGMILTCLAIVGDLIGSFIKRRLNLRQGAPFPILDQLDFIIPFILVGEYLGFISLTRALIALLLTPPIHLFMNIIAYLLKLKSNPW